MFIMLMANNSPLRNQTPPCNGNPTLILKIFQPHRDLGYWKIQQAPPGTRGGAHYVCIGAASTAAAAGMVSTGVGDTPTIIDGPPIGSDPPKSKFRHFGPQNVLVGGTESHKL